MGVVVMGPNAHQQSCLPGLARDRSESPPRLVSSGSKEEARKRSKYRLASTFELSDEQPKNIRTRARSVPRHAHFDASSHDRLFGQPTPAIQRRLRRIELGRDDGRKVRPSYERSYDRGRGRGDGYRPYDRPYRSRGYDRGGRGGYAPRGDRGGYDRGGDRGYSRGYSSRGDRGYSRGYAPRGDRGYSRGYDRGYSRGSYDSRGSGYRGRGGYDSGPRDYPSTRGGSDYRPRDYSGSGGYPSDRPRYDDRGPTSSSYSGGSYSGGGSYRPRDDDRGGYPPRRDYAPSDRYESRGPPPSSAPYNSSSRYRSRSPADRSDRYSSRSEYRGDYRSSGGGGDYRPSYPSSDRKENSYDRGYDPRPRGDLPRDDYYSGGRAARSRS